MICKKASQIRLNLQKVNYSSFKASGIVITLFQLLHFRMEDSVKNKLFHKLNKI